MKEYDVKITETLEKTVTVEAKSRADAEEQVRSAYYNSEYILDSENFTGVEFGTTEEREIQQEQAETMTVLLVKPHMYPQQIQIGCELEDLQKAVGGDIEAVYPFNEPVALVMHDEGKIMGKDLNRALRDGDGEIYDIIAGDFLVVGLGEEDFSSLSPELMKQFEEHFHQPETFVRMGRSIMALPLPDDKTAIYDEWCSFLNFFDSSVQFELSFMNMSTDAESFEKSIRIPFRKDNFNASRAEYSQILKKQLSQGNNGLTKTKYLTFGIEAESMRQAKPRLNHIENDLLNNFRRLGVMASTMNGKERLRLMHSMFHMGDNDKFFFDWKYLVESGLSVKDFIAPTAFAFKNSRTFQMGSIYGSMSYLQIIASDLSDRMLADFLDMESSQIVTMHIQSVDQTAAIKTIKRTITELDRSKIEEQKKAVRSGYDMDIIPSDLATYGKDAKALLKELQSQNERMFMLTFLVMNTGRTEQELENNVFQAQSIAQKHNCNLRRLDFQQEQGLMSSLPLAQNLIEIRRGLTTSSTAIFVPFTTQELFQNGAESLYYGLNALSNNLIMVDRKKLKNPNGLILGTPGSGKSFSAKREITNAFLVTDDDIIICDPEAEYAALVHKFEGQVIKISSSSTNYINPMDININYSEDDNPVALKADFMRRSKHCAPVIRSSRKRWTWILM